MRNNGMKAMDTSHADVTSHIAGVMQDLRRYARALLRDPTDADDLVQDCLERVITNWHGRRFTSRTRSWTFTILHNLAMNHLRKKFRRGVHLSIDIVCEDSLKVPADQDQFLYVADLKAAFEALSDEHRHLMSLIVARGFTYREAATELGIPIGTVMSRLARARELLRFAIEEGARPRADRARIISSASGPSDQGRLAARASKYRLAHKCG